jgi:hypothetical protein
MQQKASLLRWVLTGLLLAGLFFGAAGQSLARVEAASGLQACLNPIVEWNFNDGTINPSPGTAGTMVAGIGIVGPAFVDRATLDDKAVSYNQWNTKLEPTDYLEFQVSTTGRNAIQLSFDAKSSPKNLFQFVLQYSVNGGANYTSVSPSLIEPAWIGPQWNTWVIGFSPTKGLENNSNVRFRLKAYYTDVMADLFVDNISITGGCANYFDTLTPSSTPTLNPSLRVIISEVAWMGTVASTSDEWIELYNPLNYSINLNGWKLQLKGGDTTATYLDGTIQPNGYYLLAKHADDVDIPPNGILNFTLPDGGAILELWAPTALPAPNNFTLVDTANGNGGAWPAGISSSCAKGSMERTSVTADIDSIWVTNTAAYRWSHYDSGTTTTAPNIIQGTPGGQNWIFKSPNFVTDPTPVASKAVVISEVAWSGTTANAADEWLELQNPSLSDIDLRGWSLRADDGTPTIALDGTIPATGFFLIEHRGDDTVSDVDADLFYEYGCTTASLNDSGEILRLYDPSNAVVDTANNNGGAWPAGRSTNRLSMERRGPAYGDVDASWITNTGVRRNGHDSNNNPINGTPKKPNWAFNVTPTPLASATPTRTSTPVPVAAPILVINEFLPRPGHDWNNDGAVNVYDEFIEVMNAGTVNVTLSGYKLDDYEQDADGKVISNGFTLPGITLKPGEKAVFYASQTGILLSDSGDTVRLLRASNNAVLDGYTYPIVKSLDVSICRLTDGYGSWLERCFPTPGLPNALTGEQFPSASDGEPASVCVLPDTVPEEFVLAECEESGLGIWNRSYWDSLSGEGDEIWQSEESGKGTVIYY